VAACRVLCVSRTLFRMSLAVDVHHVPYSASLTLYGTCRTSIARLILNSVVFQNCSNVTWP